MLIFLRRNYYIENKHFNYLRVKGSSVCLDDISFWWIFIVIPDPVVSFVP